MKHIVIQPFSVDPKQYWGYPEELQVASSSHPRFTPGTRFDYGFHQIAMREGYVIIYLPIAAG